jgi:hypothetical protein
MRRVRVLAAAFVVPGSVQKAEAVLLKLGAS